MCAIKERITYVIYAIITCEQAIISSKIPKQYEEFQNVFKKKDTIIFAKHFLYNRTKY